MKKTDIVTGSILEIPLEKGYGFGYVKLIFSKDVQPEYFDKKIIKVYNLFRNERLRREDFKKEDFQNDNLAMYPLIMHGLPNVRGEHKWIFKGVSGLSDEDKIIPDFLGIKLHNKLWTSNVKEETKGKFGCAIVRNFANKRIYTRDYEAIKHIGNYIYSSPRAIRTQLTMYWMNRNGHSISEFYSKEDFENDFWLAFTRNLVLNNDIDFTKIKYEGRLKATIVAEG